MKKLVPFLFFLSFTCSAQVTFEKKITGYFVPNVIQVSDGGYLLYNLDYPDITLIKMDWGGNLLWAKTYGGANNDKASHLQEVNDKGFVIVGETNSFGAGGRDIYLLKVDSIGNLLWSKTIGGNKDDIGTYVQQTSDKGFIIAGQTLSFGNVANGYLVKTDSIGNLEWNKVLGGTANYLQSVNQTKDGGFMVCGMDTSVFVFKTNFVGDTLWAKLYKQNSSYPSVADYQLNSVSPIKNGFLISCTNTAANFIFGYYFRIDSLGNSNWMGVMDGTIGPGCYTNYNRIESIQPTLDNGCIFLHKSLATCTMRNNTTYQGSADISKIDSNAVFVWRNDYMPGLDYQSVNTTSDSSYIVSATSATDVFILKTDKICNTACYSGYYSFSNSPSNWNLLFQKATFTITSGGNSTNAPTIVTNGSPVIANICAVDIAPHSIPSGLKIYPNPASEKFTVETESSSKGILLIHNVDGQTVFARNFQKTMIINTNVLSEGVYYLSIENEGGTCNKKLVIIK
ncbi:MAG TPA: T9SS type A sorting domain-containing protein [Bacteroidia bacterium]|jgi:hypothetical protein|nr:T9SS type A sorting domain-containing protein [Bacteroidia bacterium]